MSQIIPITKDEAAYLRAHREVRSYISHRTTHQKYYLTEDRGALRLLRTYRETVLPVVEEHGAGIRR